MARVFAGLTLAGFVELIVAIAVGRQVGASATLLAILVMSVIGGLIVRREGTATWRKFTGGLQSGQVPTAEVIDGGIVVIAGALLLLPGFISGSVAVLLMFPPLRKLVRLGSAGQMQKRVVGRMGQPGTTGVFNVGFGGGGSPFGEAFGHYHRPTDGEVFDTSSSVRRDDDIIDLDAEVVFIDDPVAELDPPEPPEDDFPGAPS